MTGTSNPTTNGMRQEAPPASEDGAGAPGIKDSESRPKRGFVGPGTGDGWFGLLKPKQGAEQCLPVEEIVRFHQKALTLKDATNDVAEEFAASIRVAQKIRARDIYIPSAAERLNFIFDCLLLKPPLLVLARDARLQMQIELYRKSGWISRALARISDGSPVGLVLSALIASFVLWTILAASVYSLVHYLNVGLAGDVFFMNGRALAVISSAAFVGGVISIATRLQEFSRVRDLDPFAMFWTALLKPLIGVVLSFFILATLAGGVVSFGFLPQKGFAELAGPKTVTVNAPAKPEGTPAANAATPAAAAAQTSATSLSDDALKTLYVLWMLGFLAGFSERFAWDFVNRAEGATSTSSNGNRGGNTAGGNAGGGGGGGNSGGGQH